VKSMLTFFL